MACEGGGIIFTKKSNFKEKEFSFYFIALNFSIMFLLHKPYKAVETSGFELIRRINLVEVSSFSFSPSQRNCTSKILFTLSDCYKNWYAD